MRMMPEMENMTMDRAIMNGWKVSGWNDNCDAIEIVDEDGVVVAQVFEESPITPLGYDYDAWAIKAKKRDDTRAALIAAAPELLEACRLVHSRGFEYGVPEKLEAAIAKAEGN